MKQPVMEKPLALRDIHLPEAIGWWPPAPGWWLLLAALVIGIIAILLLRAHYRSRQLRREVRAELDRIRQHHASTANDVRLVRELSALLRRASLSYYPQHNTGGLTGQQWLVFLAATHARRKSSAAETCSFHSPCARVLLTAPYLADDSDIKIDSDELLALCESWLLQRHRGRYAAAVHRQQEAMQP